MTQPPRQQDVTFDSLKNDLQSGLSLATRARKAHDDHHKRERNRAAAQTTCRRVTHLMVEATLAAAQRDELTAALKNLRAAIDAVSD